MIPRDRIKELRRVPASELLENERNFRKHPKAQRSALRGLLKEIGVADACIARELPDGRLRLIDGHLRRDELKGATVPVLVLDVTEDEADKLLASIDPLAAMAETDDRKLQDLLAGLQSQEQDVQKFFASLSNGNGDEPEEDEPDAAARSTGIYAFREDAIFPSSSRWGIPDLRPDMLSDQVPDHTWAGPAEAITDPSKLLFLYGENRMEPEQVKGGALGFYSYDAKFEIVWNDAVRVIERFKACQWGAIVAPDFSTWSNDPLVIQAYNVYRSRWCARYWQEAGFRIIPSLAFSDERSFEFAFDGMPVGAPLVSAQMRTGSASKRDRRLYIDGLREALHRLKPEALMIYGDTSRAWLEPSLPQGIRYHWIASRLATKERLGLLNRNKEA